MMNYNHPANQEKKKSRIMLKSARISASHLNQILFGCLDANEIETGIYIINHHNFHNDILNEKDDYPQFGDDYKYGSYGVGDTIEQVKEAYSEWLNAPDIDYCISFCKVVKSEQPENGGWRWHKWGNYIGTKEPLCEYLYDEPNINEVYCYHIYQLLD